MAKNYIVCHLEDKMASYSTNEFKAGLKVMLDNDPCAIIENEFVKPGKGQALIGSKSEILKQVG